MKKMLWILLMLCFGFSLEATAQDYMQRRRWLEEGIAALGETNLVQPIHETQEIDGVSFEIIQAYADSHIFIFWYAIRGLELPEGQIYGRFFSAGLTNADGSWHPNSGAYQIDPVREDGVIYGAFEYGHVSDYPTDGVYKQRLTVTIGDTWQGLHLLPDDYVVDGNPIPEEYQYEIPTYGEYTFELRLNVLPELVINVGETVESNGVSLTLEQVRVLPFYVGLELCYEMPNDDDYWYADARILLEDGESLLSNGGESDFRNPERPCNTSRFLDTVPLDTERLSIEIPRFITSVPMTISPELAERAEAELAELGIIVDYVEDSSFNYEVIEIPEEYEDEAGWLIYDALREEFEGDWAFTVELPESLFGE